MLRAPPGRSGRAFFLFHTFRFFRGLAMATMITNASGVAVFQSRWGFHPCSYEDFQRFRVLHWRTWCWMKMAMIHHRWERKHPDNRHGPEPILCEGQRKLGLDDLGMKK